MPANKTRSQKQVTRIGIDTRNTILPFGTGVASYAASLSNACREAGFAPQWLAAKPIASKTVRFAHAMLPWQKLDGHFSAPDIYRVAHIHFKIYQNIMKLHCDDPPALMHWTYPLPLMLKGCKNILTVHDLIALRQPESTTIDGPRLRRLLSILLRRFDGIVTVSETVRTQLIESFDIDPAQVRTLYQPVEVTPAEVTPPESAPPESAPPESALPVCNLEPVRGSFIVVGSVEPRKNIRRIIAAYQQSKAAPALLIIGPDGTGAASELAGLRGNVIRIPFLPRTQLLAALRQARALIFPSLAEGFGLPMIEAFACGVPVLAARGGAMEEIAGGAALLVDPEDEQAIATGIQQLATDDGLCARLSALGLRRAEFFSMDTYAARLKTYYETILAS